MSAKTKSKTKAEQLETVAAKEPKPAKGKTPRTIEADAPAKSRKTSALDAAAKVLGEAGKPMNCQDLIAAMTEKGLWTSPKGKTPQATLYAAMMREINTKGKEARFQKADRGQFALVRERRTAMTITDNHDPNDYEKVPLAWRCPQCGEADMDWLVWIDDDQIRCANCGTVYDPNRGESAG